MATVPVGSHSNKEMPSNWGIVMALMGVVKDFKGMVACRVFLGLREAGFFPGAIHIVSSRYPRYELQQRLAIFYTASAFSGALRYAIARMDGLRGVAGQDHGRLENLPRHSSRLGQLGAKCGVQVHDDPDHVAVLYFAVVLAQIGIYPLLPGIST